MSTTTTSLPPAPTGSSRSLPPFLRGVAWFTYLVTLGLLAWAGAQLAFRQVPPLDPAKDGPIHPGTRVAIAVFPEGYPLAREQKILRDYLFTQAAGADASDYVQKGEVRLLEPAAAGTAPEGLSTPEANEVTILKYDGDLIQLKVPQALGPLWGPKKPLEKVVEAKGKKGGGE